MTDPVQFVTTPAIQQAVKGREEEVLDALGVDRDRTQKFLGDLQRQFQGTYVYDLGALRDTATRLQPVLDHVATGGKLQELTETPTRIELTCHQALACAGDPHATHWLSRAHTALMTDADAIGDVSLRKGYLQNVPHHREVVAAWAMRSTPPR